MLLPILVALALQSVPDAAAPVATAPAIASVPAKAVRSAADTSDIPNGAPTDDYGFVAWCRGALTGHMDLYPSVKTELQKVEAEKAEKEDAKYTTDAQREAAVKRRTKDALADTKLDEEQLEAGRMYVKLYTEALDAAEAASAQNLHKRGEEAQDAGFRIWAAARGAEPRTRMWSWIMWELPARCETAARRLKDQSSLLGGALKARVEAKAETPAPLAKAAESGAVSDAPAEAAAKAPESPAAADAAAAAAVKPSGAEPAGPPAFRGELPPTPPADAPVSRREAEETPAPAPAEPKPAEPKP